MKNLNGQRNYLANGFDVWLWERTNDGALYVASDGDIVLAKTEELTPATPTLTLSKSSAQALLDDLYLAGFRPTATVATEVSLDAQRAHIVSLEKIVDTLLPAVLSRLPTATD